MLVLPRIRDDCCNVGYGCAAEDDLRYHVRYECARQMHPYRLDLDSVTQPRDGLEILVVLLSLVLGTG